MAQQTPFMARLQELQTKPTVKLPEVPMQPQETTLLKSAGGTDYSSIGIDSQRTQVQESFEKNKGRVQQKADELRGLVAAGTISPADSEAQLDAFITDVVDGEFTGFKEMERRSKAAKYAAEHKDVSAEEAYNMFQMGYDPDVIKRARNMSNQSGILMNSMKPESEAPLMGQGTEPLMTGEVQGTAPLLGGQ